MSYIIRCRDIPKDIHIRSEVPSQGDWITLTDISGCPEVTLRIKAIQRVISVVIPETSAVGPKLVGCLNMVYALAEIDPAANELDALEIRERIQEAMKAPSP